MRKSTLLPAAGVEIGLVLRCAIAKVTRVPDEPSRDRAS
jgi:hypothetical protein